MLVDCEDGVDVGLIVTATLGGCAHQGLTAACDGGVGHRVQPGQNLADTKKRKAE